MHLSSLSGWILAALGPGLFEHVYEVILAYELGKQHLAVERQVPIPIIYEEKEGFANRDL